MRGVILILTFYYVYSVQGQINLKRNSCKTYLDYFTRFINKNCYYDDEFFLRTPQILEKRKILYENHTIVTEDGYILSVFRMLKRNRKGVIVMLHPIVQDSTTWFSGGNESYVNRFFNAGYELWLVNWRGVTYSDKHVANLPPAQYWNFSFHEIGVYDYSAVFRYVNNITNSKIISFSMSIGSTASSIYASEKSEEAKQLIKIFIALAVPDFLRDSTTLIRILVPFIPLVKVVTRILGVYAFFHNTQWLTVLLTNFMLLLNAEWLFSLISPLLVGGSFSSVNPRILPRGLSVTPQATSIKTLEHFAQFLENDNKFVQFDYGKTKNLQMYNSEKPPSYRLENINVPFHIILGESDNLANKKGNLLLYSKLPDIAKKYGYIEVPGCSHADFLIGKTQPDFVQNHVLKLLERIST